MTPLGCRYKNASCSLWPVHFFGHTRCLIGFGRLLCMVVTVHMVNQMRKESKPIPLDTKFLKTFVKNFEKSEKQLVAAE